jgi:hypothetical protein
MFTIICLSFVSVSSTEVKHTTFISILHIQNLVKVKIRE